MLKSIRFIIIGLVLASIIGTCIYFVAGVSSTFPPIKEYEFSGSVDQLLAGIREYTILNPNAKLTITDTTGGKENGYGIYMDVELKKDTSLLLYNLECEKIDQNNNPPKTLIKLIGAFNKHNYKVGGYGIKGIGVKGMIDDFEIEFLMRLKRQKHMTINALAVRNL